MFNQRVYIDQETYEEANFNPADFSSSFFPNIPLESFGAELFPRDDPGFYVPQGDFEGFDQGLPFLIDPNIYQSFHEDFKRFIPGFDIFSGFIKDGPMPEIKPNYMVPKPVNNFPSGKKIGTISVEERRLKVKKFLEKRKRRIFKKRISYACRKRVADSRVRVKGRFITKEQAALLNKEVENADQSEEEKES